MDSEEEDIMIFMSAVYLCTKGKKRKYMREINEFRDVKGERSLVADMRNMDEQQHIQYFRMDSGKFDTVLKYVEKDIWHKPNHRFPISPTNRLAVTLRILATGDTYQTVAASYRMGSSTVAEIESSFIFSVFTV